MPAHLERGPVALWWYYRGKLGDPWVAFFLRRPASLPALNREDVRKVRPQLVRQQNPRKSLGKSPNLGNWDATTTPIEKPLRTDPAFQSEL